jgi:EAL domain-containing protein (putative c-di-GMP-specific phosphodiesterase class I)
MAAKRADAVAGLRVPDTRELEPVRAEDLKRRRHGSAPGSRRWHLESLADDGELARVTIGRFPFRVGRLQGLELMLPADSVSKTHAEIYADAAGLRVRDFGSTNGTYVNGEVVDDAGIREGDVLHFANFEFRVASSPEERPASPSEQEPPTTVSLGRRRLSHRFVPGTRELKELLEQGAVTVVFQPIVVLPGGVPAAYEALGRGTHPGLPQSPLELFKIAESIGAEAELSRLFRQKAVELASQKSDLPTLFLNTHPGELSQPGLLESLETLRGLAPQQDLALEIHESVLTGASALAELRTLLSESNISLAYDDFGAGQARLLELAEAPPHYLKFDRRFVTDIDKPDNAKRRRLLSSLVGVARDLLVKTIAEGVETSEEADVCRKIGFAYGQGYYFGRPAPVDKM